MMQNLFPTVWRFFLARFWLFWFLLCFALEFLFIAAKIQDIARFTVLTGSLNLLFHYIGLQLVLLFPVAAAGSCLISMAMLIREQIRTSQLTAWRAAGYSLRLMLLPLLASVTLLAALNFAAILSAVPAAYRSAKTLASQQMENTPLENLTGYVGQVPGAYISAIPAEPGHLKDVWIFSGLDHEKALQAIHLKSLSHKPTSLSAQDIDLLTYVPPKDKRQGFDHIVHEHHETLVAPVTWLSESMRPPASAHSLSSCTLSELIRREGFFQELIRRGAWALAPLTCLAIGMAIGLQSCRLRKPLSLRIALALSTTLFFILLFLIRKMTGSPLLIGSAALFTHGQALGLSLWICHQYNRGKI